MKKRNIVFWILIVVSIIMTIVSMVCAVHGIPVQDPQEAPARVLQTTHYYSVASDVLFVGGGLLFWGTIIWRVVLAIVSKSKKKA